MWPIAWLTRCQLVGDVESVTAVPVEDQLEFSDEVCNCLANQFYKLRMDAQFLAFVLELDDEVCPLAINCKGHILRLLERFLERYLGFRLLQGHFEMRSDFLLLVA